MDKHPNKRLEKLEQRIALLERQEEQLKRALLTSEEHLNLALSAGNIAWWEMEVATGRVTFDQNKAKMLGYQMEDFQDAHYSAFTELIHPDDYEKAMQAMRDHLTGKKPLYEVTYRIKHKEGDYIWFYDRGSATVRTKEGKPIFVKGVVFDDTERQKALNALNASKQKLKKANKTKDQFLSIISHDLKNPIYAILGLSRIINKRYEEQDDRKRRNLLSKLEAAAKNTYSLLEQLLNWSKSQRDEIDFHPEKLSLNELVQEVFGLLQETAQQKQITLHSNLSANTMVIADKPMLYTILRNLISNALKFSFQGGQVAITSHNKMKGFIEVAVKDNGIGIPQEEIPKLQSLEHTYKQKGTNNEEGTGLGLILCKNFIEKHGGRLTISSEEQKGTTVSITLPEHRT